MIGPGEQEVSLYALLHPPLVVPLTKDLKASCDLVSVIIVIVGYTGVWSDGMTPVVITVRTKDQQETTCR